MLKRFVEGSSPPHVICDKVSKFLKNVFYKKTFLHDNFRLDIEIKVNPIFQTTDLYYLKQSMENK